MKKTDAGFIPETWSAAKVTDTIKIAQGQVDPKKAPFDEMILVAPDHIESGTGRLTRKLTAKEQGAISGKYLFSSGDIVYSKIRPYLKKAIVADFDGLCSADMYPLTPRQGISAGYILALILGEKFSSYAESVSMRSGMPKINRTELSQYIWAVPPSEEQNAIALASSDIDALLAKLDQLIAKKRDIKQAAMQELLTGRRRLPGFSDEWKMAALRNLGVWKGGATPSMSNPDFWENGEIPWASSADIKSTTIDATAKTITALAVESSSTTVVPAESVVMVTRSGILRRYFPVAKTSKPIAINQDIKALIPASSVDTEFVLQSLLLHGPDILSSCMKAGTTRRKCRTLVVEGLRDRLAQSG